MTYLYVVLFALGYTNIWSQRLGTCSTAIRYTVQSTVHTGHAKKRTTLISQ